MFIENLPSSVIYFISMTFVSYEDEFFSRNSEIGEIISIRYFLLDVHVVAFFHVLKNITRV